MTDFQQGWLAAKTVDHSVSLVDDLCHVVVMIDQQGRVVIHCEERR